MLFNVKLDANLAIIRKIAILLILAFCLYSAALAQDPNSSPDSLPRYIGGGLELGQSTPTLSGGSSTIAGGFVAGKYQLLRFLEFQGKMKITDQSQFSFSPNTTLEIDPLMLMSIRVTRHLEILAGGGVIGQMITGAGNGDSFNPDLIAGFRLSNHYQFTGGLVFNEMTGNQFDGRYRAVRLNLRAIQPLNDRVGFFLDLTHSRQQQPAPGSPRMSQVSLGTGFVIK